MRPPTILVVDDDLDQHVVCGAFLEHAGFRVLHAYDGAEGIRVARSERPELILMDLRMPGMDGLQAFRQLVGDPATHGIPVVAVTADVLEWPEHRALAEGFAAYLPKPCYLPQIRETSLRLLSAPTLDPPLAAAS